jgi:hypothetical protein
LAGGLQPWRMGGGCGGYADEAAAAGAVGCICLQLAASEALARRLGLLPQPVQTLGSAEVCRRSAPLSDTTANQCQSQHHAAVSTSSRCYSQWRSVLLTQRLADDPHGRCAVYCAPIPPYGAVERRGVDPHVCAPAAESRAQVPVGGRGWVSCATSHPASGAHDRSKQRVLRH